MEKPNTEKIIIIPSIADPRNTVTSISTFQNAFSISPPIPIVIIYGTCPDSHRAVGENMKERSGWDGPWDRKRLEEYKNRFRQISEQNGVPIYFFDIESQRTVWDGLLSKPMPKSLPGNITRETYHACINEMFGATYSYGAQRNKAFMIANKLSADTVFFFDDDIYFTSTQGNIIERHLELLLRKNVNAVTGGYIGQRAFNTTIFRRIEEQQEFMGLLGYDIPDDQATSDLWGWRIADGVLGGNFCVKRKVYKKVCCPSAYRIPTTDDKLIGREIHRIFHKDGHVYKTGWGVIHIHFPARMDPAQVQDYLKSWAKTKAFWRIYYDINKKHLNLLHLNRNIRVRLHGAVRDAVIEFGEKLIKLAKTERKIAPGEISKAIEMSAKTIMNTPEEITKIVLADVERFEIMKHCWPLILKRSKEINIFTRGENLFYN